MTRGEGASPLLSKDRTRRTPSCLAMGPALVRKTDTMLKEEHEHSVALAHTGASP